MTGEPSGLEAVADALDRAPGLDSVVPPMPPALAWLMGLHHGRVRDYTHAHFREPDDVETLCGRPADRLLPAHPSDRTCPRCRRLASAEYDRRAQAAAQAPSPA